MFKARQTFLIALDSPQSNFGQNATNISFRKPNRVEALVSSRAYAQAVRAGLNLFLIRQTVMISTILNPLSTASQCANFVELLRFWAHHSPDKVAFRYLHRGEIEAQSLTYQALDTEAQAIAAHLQSIHAVGERALLLYSPGLDFIKAFLGCLYAGVTAVPAYPPRRNQKLLRLQALVENAQAKVVMTDSSFWKYKDQWLQEEPHWAQMQWLNTHGIEFSGANWTMPCLTDHSLAFLQYTSGSTGTPKGVMISHGNLMHNSLSIQRCFQNTNQSTGISWLPPYHDMGLIGGILQPIFVGAEMVLMSPVDFLQKPMRWLQAVSRYQVTTSGAPNFAYGLCADKFKPEQVPDLDLSSWKVAFTGAEPVRAETLDRFITTFEPYGFRQEAFYPCYGMAETTLIVSGGSTTAPPVIESLATVPLEHHQVVKATAEFESRTFVGCGQSLDDQQLLIVDPATKRLCPPNRVGEIWVSGASVAQGYWNNPEATQDTFAAYVADAEAGPFLRTGDLGFLQEGELFITGRIKDVVIIRGQNYYPQDIELTVQLSHPALSRNSLAAFSIEVQGTERLVIVSEVERSYLRNLNLKEIVGDIRQMVTNHHSLQVYAVALLKPGSIPKTSSGKIRRHACKADFLGGNLNIVADWSENPQFKSDYLAIRSQAISLLETLQRTS